jgi:hypothetical protein
LLLESEIKSEGIKTRFMPNDFALFFIAFASKSNIDGLKDIPFSSLLQQDAHLLHTKFQAMNVYTTSIYK